MSYCTLDESVKGNCPLCEAELLKLRKQSALLRGIYEMTAARDRRGEPEIGGDFKIAVEYLLGIEDEMADALGAKVWTEESDQAGSKGDEG